MAGGNDFDVKIGYNKRAAATRDLTTILQDIEGVPLTDESGASLITEVEGFVTSELTSEKALSVGLPVEIRDVNKFYSFLFGAQFETNKKVLNAQNQVATEAAIRITDPDPTWKFIQRGTKIEAATGEVRYEPGTTIVKGNTFQEFQIKNVVEEGNVGPNGEFVVKYELEEDPENDDSTPGRQPISYIRRLIVKERTGVLGIVEQFAAASEVSSSLLGIDRAETQLGLFSNVSTYGLNTDEFVFYTDNPYDGPDEWTGRESSSGEKHFPARLEEVKNEGALKICSYPVPYKFPYSPRTEKIVNGVDINGVFNLESWRRWQNFVRVGKSLYEYYRDKRDDQTPSADPNSNYVKYDNLLGRFLPAINIWDDDNYYNSQYYGGSNERYYKRISIWTDSWHLIENAQLFDTVNGEAISFAFLTLQELGLRGTGTILDNPDLGIIGAGSYGNESSIELPNKVFNPFEETWINADWDTAASGGSVPDLVDFRPGYGPTGGHFALLQSRQAFRYQPGRISGYTFGTRATLDKNQGDNYAEWGIFNDFDEYVFRREGANFYIVRRSNIPYPIEFLRELGAVDEFGNEDAEIITNYTKVISNVTYNMQEVKLGREKFNGDSLNGNGPSGYLLTTDEITMYKIEFGWYGAIGLRLYAYIPVDNGQARWVVVHTFVIENKLNVPSMGDPFFKFKNEIRIGSGQGPDLTIPQVLYKYGTSMYIDGGDEGKVDVFSETSDSKLLPAGVGTGDYVSLFGIYPKKDIVSGNGDLIPNKKIIIPKQMSITADGFAEINIFKCRGCVGSQFLYLPNITANDNGILRKLKKVNELTGDTELVLAPITITTSAAGGSLTTVTTTDPDIQYLRNGDRLLDTDINGVLIAGVETGRITDISETSGTYTITIKNVNAVPSEETSQTYTNATDLVFQPTFITTTAERRDYGLEYDDFEAKVIYPHLYNTYIGRVSSGIGRININTYVGANRHEIDTERFLDPRDIIDASIPIVPPEINFTPRDFFGDPLTETFDVRLSQRKSVIASDIPVTGPDAALKWLRVDARDGTAVADWRMGFTPNKPIIDQFNGELLGWIKPGDNPQPLTELRGGIEQNVINLPESEYVSLDYHAYETGTNLNGFEGGEDWGARILPFTVDFRIPSPPGSNSGRCSEMQLSKQDPISVSVIEVQNSVLQALSPSASGGLPLSQWSGLNTIPEIDEYLGAHTHFLSSNSPIIGGTRSPINGQFALNKNGIFDVNFYDNTQPNPISQTGRFQDIQISYAVTSVSGDVQINYIVPINLSVYNSFESDGVTPIVTPNQEFLIAYNKVTLRAWFSAGGSAYDTPNSYSTGPNSDGIFEFSAFPLYPFAFLRDKADIRSLEVHNTDLLGNRSTYNPQWKCSYVDGNPSADYSVGSNLQTGQLNVNGVGSLEQTPVSINDLKPSSFTQVTRLSSSQVDKQGESLLRPGDNLTTLYINNETKTFDLTDVFGFDRKVITPDIVNTEAVFFVGRSLNSSSVDIQINLTYVEQL